jgi:hypothetical protein
MKGLKRFWSQWYHGGESLPGAYRNPITRIIFCWTIQQNLVESMRSRSEFWRKEGEGLIACINQKGKGNNKKNNKKASHF